MFFKKKNKEIKRSELRVVSADKVIVRNALFNKEIEASKKIILICYHLVDYLAYICLVAGVIVFFLIPIAGLVVVALSKLFFDIGNQYEMVLKMMTNFKSGNEK